MTDQEEEKEGEEKKRLGFYSVLGFRGVAKEIKEKKSGRKILFCVGAYDDCHDYDALSRSCCDEIVLGVTKSS